MQVYRKALEFCVRREVEIPIPISSLYEKSIGNPFERIGITARFLNENSNFRIVRKVEILEKIKNSERLKDSDFEFLDYVLVFYLSGGKTKNTLEFFSEYAFEEGGLTDEELISFSRLSLRSKIACLETFPRKIMSLRHFGIEDLSFEQMKKLLIGENPGEIEAFRKLQFTYRPDYSEYYDEQNFKVIGYFNGFNYEPVSSLIFANESTHLTNSIKIFRTYREAFDGTNIFVSSGLTPGSNKISNIMMLDLTTEPEDDIITFQILNRNLILSFHWTEIDSIFRNYKFFKIFHERDSIELSERVVKSLKRRFPVLTKSIKYVRTFQTEIGIHSKAIADYEDKREAITFYSDLLDLAFLMRGWKVVSDNKPMTSEDTCTPPELQFIIETNVSKQIDKIMKYPRLFLTTPLVKFVGDKFVFDIQPAEGSNLETRIEILKKGESEFSCTRLTSNVIMATGYYHLQQILEVEPDFDIKTMSHIF